MPSTSCLTSGGKWLSFPSSELGRNIFYGCSCSSTTSKLVYLFLGSISPRLSNSNKFFLASCRLLFGFQVVRQCFAPKLSYFSQMYVDRWQTLMTSISPLASSAVKLLPHHSRSIWQTCSLFHRKHDYFRISVGAISVLWVTHTLTQAWKLLNPYSVYLLDFYYMSSEGVELENFRPTKKYSEYE